MDRTEVLLLTSLNPYRQATPAHGGGGGGERVIFPEVLQNGDWRKHCFPKIRRFKHLLRVGNRSITENVFPTFLAWAFKMTSAAQVLRYESGCIGQTKGSRQN